MGTKGVDRMSEHQSELDMVKKGKQLNIKGEKTPVKTTGKKVDSKKVERNSEGYDTAKEVRAGRQKQIKGMEKEIIAKPEDKSQRSLRSWSA